MLVTPVWNEIIGDSVKCMSNLKLVITEDEKTFENVSEILLKSERKYSKIEINYGKKEIETIQTIVEMRNDYACLKVVELYNAEFKNSSQLVSFISIFESSVENLIFQGVTVGETENVSLNFNFGNLKTLKINYCHQEIFIDMFLNSSNLESITVGNSKVKTAKPFKLIQMLRNSQNLKQLNLNAELFSTIFANDISDLPNCLQDFSITNFGIRIDINKTGKNFKKFLQAQSKSLKKLYLGDFFGVEILKYVFTMKSLKELKMIHLPVLIFETMQLRTNTTLETLDVYTTDIKNKIRIKCLLRAVPKVKRLRLRSIDTELAQFIKQNLKQLRVIQMLNPLEENLGKSKKILSHVKFF